MADYSRHSYWLETCEDDLTPRPAMDGSIDVDIAILGAVLQNRIIANVTEGTRDIPGMPEAARQDVIDGLSDGGMGMSMPTGGEGMPAAAVEMMKALFRSWFTEAVNTTFVVGVAFCVVGTLCALLLRSHVGRDEPTKPPDLA